ncbi:hypothetical protein J3R30DRAFT_3695128 [Lentinula aciculospora]|uniref:Uncharacterized protein n=1 Tax=Lentinula aciculospora TaxID=153920 RepID=A0A9W9APG6_9AGAR|nr:hypothetical protein J3R30DRAFT_3695128 [Lentinula aciculospora]
MSSNSHTIHSPFRSKPSNHSIEPGKADVVRLLDPSYCLPHSPSEPVKAYVDSKGQMHDPDFRQFPVCSSKKASSGRSPFASGGTQWVEEVAPDNKEEETPHQHHRNSTRFSRRHDSGPPSTNTPYNISSYASSSSSSLSSDSSSSKNVFQHHSISKIRSFDLMDWYYPYDSHYTCEDPIEVQMIEEYIPEPDFTEHTCAQALPLSYCQRIKERWARNRLGDAFKRKQSKLSTVSYP